MPKAKLCVKDRVGSGTQYFGFFLRTWESVPYLVISFLIIPLSLYIRQLPPNSFPISDKLNILLNTFLIFP